MNGFLQRYEQPQPGKVVPYRKPPKAAGFKPRLYEIADYPPDKAQILETDFMRALDTEAADVHKMLLTNNVASVGEAARSAWATFLMSLFVRNPRNLEHYKTGFSATFNKPQAEIQARYEAMKTEYDPETVEEYLAQFSPRASVTAAMEQLPAIIQNEFLGRHIVNMLWLTIEITKGDFLISDEPLIMSNGIGKPDGHIVMPISPKILFVAANNGATARMIDQLPRKDLVRLTNEKVVGRARNFVAANDLSQTRFIENRFGRTPEASIASLFEEKQLAKA